MRFIYFIVNKFIIIVILCGWVLTESSLSLFYQPHHLTSRPMQHLMACVLSCYK